MKRLLLVVFVVAAMLPFLPTATPSSAQAPIGQAVVCRDVTLRTERQTVPATAITTLAAGTPVEVIESDVFWINMNWSYVRVGEQEGWVAASYLTYLPRIASSLNIINLRQLPYDGAPILAQLQRGEEFEVIGRENDFTNGFWAYVRRLSDGAEGWITGRNYYTESMHRLTCQTPSLYERPTPRTMLFWPTDLARQLFVWDRTTPNADVVDFVNAGQTITVLGDVLYYGFAGELDFAGWRVRVDATGREGQLRFGATLVDLPCQAEIITAGYSTIWAAPDNTSTELQRLNFGDTVTVTGGAYLDGRAWLAVSTPTTSGWTRFEFVRRCAVERNG